MRVYATVFGALVALTAVTVIAAFVDLRGLNPAVTLLIAGVKASLVTLYFMHARQAQGIVWLWIGAGLFWLGILMILTLSDYLTRAP